MEGKGRGVIRKSGNLERNIRETWRSNRGRSCETSLRKNFKNKERNLG